MKSFLSNPDSGVQQAAIVSLSSKLEKFPKNLDLLTPKLNDENLEINSTAVYALGSKIEQFPQLKPLFLDIAQDNEKPIEMRQEATLYLSKLNTPEIKDFLVGNLDNSEWEMRQAATLGLGNFKDADIPDILAPKVNDPQWQVRQGVATSLGKFDAPKIVESLTPLLGDENAFVRQATGLSLGGKLQKFPELVNPFMEKMKIEEDPYTRHIFAAALKSMPNDSAVQLEIDRIQESLIPGLRIEPWEQIRPETGVEIGYNTIRGPINHTSLSVTYKGDTRILSFDTTNKPLGFLLPQSEGEYLKKLKAESNIMYYTVTIDPAETKRLYDLAPSLYQKQGNYNLFDIQKLGRNCFGGRNVALESAGIYSEIPDMPWEPLKPNYFSRSVSADFSDRYSSYSFRMQQEVLYSLPNTRTIKIDSWSHYQTNRQFTTPSTPIDRGRFNNKNWQISPNTSMRNRISIPDYSSHSFNYQSPNIGTHNYNTQTYQWPTYQSPRSDWPTYQSPTYQSPTFDSPAYDPPSYQSPTFTPIQSPSSNLGSSNWP